MRLPWISSVLLGLAVDVSRREDVVGDLFELHVLRRRRFGWFAAWLLTVAESLWLAMVFLTMRLWSVDLNAAWISWSELRLGARLVRKQPLMAATTVLALGVGLGIATTGFSVISGVFGAELPFTWGDRLVRFEVRTVPEGFRDRMDLSRYHLLRSSGVFEHMGAEDSDQLSVLHSSGRIESVRGTWMTPATFGRLPYRPLAGRALVAADGASGAVPVVVLRESLWRRSFSARAEVVGETIQVAGLERQVVGILPDTARFPADTEMWLPLDDEFLGGSEHGPKPGLEMFAILREVGTEVAAAEQIKILSQGLPSQEVGKPGTQVGLLPYAQSSPGEMATATLMMAILIALLVVIASNVANLTLTRTAARTDELTLRTALGAARSRLVAQLAAETAILGLIALVFGLFISRLSLQWLEPRLEYVPFWMDLSLRPRTVLFAVGLAILTCTVGGLIPAVRATGSGRSVVRGSRRGAFELGRIGSTMMVVELAASILLLCGAVAISWGLLRDLNTPTDVPVERILTARLTQLTDDVGASSVIAEPLDSAGPSEALGERVLATVLELPGVVAAGVSRRAPHREAASRRVEISGEDAEGPRFSPVAHVSPGFFDVMDARLLEGRMFRESDLEQQALIAVVDEEFVEQFLGGGSAVVGSAVGRRLRIVPEQDDTGSVSWIDIVGVVSVLGMRPDEVEGAGEIYLPWAGDSRSIFLMVRTEEDPLPRAAELWQSLASVDLGLQVSALKTLEEASRDDRALLAGFAKALVIAGFMVLLLSTVSLYAMTSFGVTRRTREIGVRLSLGASRTRIMRTVLGSTVRYLAFGGGLGAVAVIAADFFGLLQALVSLRQSFEVSWVLAAVLSAFLLAGLVATWVPVRRALGIHPADALRSD